MIVVGVAVDVIGACSQIEAIATAPTDPLSFRTRRVLSLLPADQIADEQPSWVPVDVDHDDRPVGIVRYLERAHNGSVWCVARIDQPIDLDGKSFSIRGHAFSTGAGWAPRDRWTLDSVAVTSRPAMRFLGGLKIIDADDLEQIDQTWILRTRTHDAHLSALLERARTTALARRRDGAILVHDVDAARAERRAEQHAQLHMRHALRHSQHAGSVLSVR